MNARSLVALALALTAPCLSMAEEPKAQVAVVRPGDTLTAIARRHGTTVAELQKLNDLDNPDRIRAGQELRLRGAPANPVSLRRFRAAYLGGPVAPQVDAAPARPRAGSTPIRMARFGAEPARVLTARR